MEAAAVRLKRLRESTTPKLSIRALAEMLGMPASSYAFYEDASKAKKTYLPAEFTRSLIEPFQAHGVDPAEVLALGGLEPKGGAPMVPAHDTGSRWETLLRSASTEQLTAVEQILSGPANDFDTSAAAAQQLDAVLLPEIDVAYSMGGGTEIEEYPVEQLVPFSRAWLATLTRTPATHLFVARGEGDSMQPTILDGDIVIVDRSERALRGQDRIWAVAYGGFGMIKRLRSLPNGALQINSDNTAVSPIEAFDGEAHIIGRVVGIVRRV